MKVELKINAYADREKVALGLLNSGFTVSVEKRRPQDKHSYTLGSDYFVIIEDNYDGSMLITSL